VFMENAGGGGAMAAPVAKQIFDYYVGNVEDIRRPVSIPPQLRNGSITEAETDPAVEETVPEEVVPDSPAEEQE